MFLRPTEVFRIPKAFYMIFVCFPLFGRKKKALEHNHFYWIKFAVHERLSYSHVQVLTITSCALRAVLEKRREGEISKKSLPDLNLKKKVLFFVKYHKFAGRLVSVIAFWAYATSEAPSPPLKKYTQNAYFDLQVLFK